MAIAPTKVSPDDLETQKYPASFEFDAPGSPEPEALVEKETALEMRKKFQHGKAPSTLSSLPSATSVEPIEEAADPEPPQEASS